MNQIDPVSRPLEFTPVFWIALLLVGLIGLSQFFQTTDQTQTLSYLEGTEPLIIRSSNESHRFPVLGIEIDVTDGWTYLSTAEDTRALAPTFVHESSHSIIRLQPFRLRSWPPEGAKLEVERYGDLEIEWAEVDHRRVGRLRQPPIDLSIFVVSHQHHARLSQEIRDFCGRIRTIR